MRRSTPSIVFTAVLLGAHPALAQQVEHAEPASPARLAGTARELGAIGRAIAAALPGDTIEIGPGVYREHIRIDKPLTLVGKGRPVIDGGGAGDIIEITAAGVVVRGFTIRNTGTDLDKENAALRALAPRTTIEDNIFEDILFGIDMREAPSSVIRGNRIGGKKLDIARRGDGLRLWRSGGTVVENNVLHDGRDAIMWYSAGVTVRGNTAYDCRYGLHLMFSDDILIEDNTFAGNSVGIYLMYSTGVNVRGNRLTRNRGPSGYGLGLKETDRYTVEGNLIAGNRVGIYIDGSPFTDAQPGVFTKNTVAHNDVGITFLPSAKGNELYENNFIDNIDQVSVAGRGGLEANRFWKGDVGNYWSDYTGYDQDRDGVGDFVHESYTLFENMMDKQPRLRLFLFSPAQQAVEFVGRAMPAVRPEPKFTDEVPLMTPVSIGMEFDRSGRSALWLAATGLGLLAAGGVIVAAAASPSWRRNRSGAGASTGNAERARS
jgi:nitrous oxidase accessory protein